MGEQKREEWIARAGRRWEGIQRCDGVDLDPTDGGGRGWCGGGGRVRESQSGVVCGLWTVDCGVKGFGVKASVRDATSWTMLRWCLGR